MKSISRVNRV